MYFLDECKHLNYRNSLVISLPLLNSFIHSTVEFPFHRHLKKSSCFPVLLILCSSVWSAHYWGSCLWFMYYMFFKKLSSFRAKGDYIILVICVTHIWKMRMGVFQKNYNSPSHFIFKMPIYLKDLLVTLSYLLFSCNVIIFISYIYIYIIVSTVFMIVLIHKNELVTQKLFIKV